MDGAQTLAYTRYYNEGDWVRGDRYAKMMEGFYKSLRKTRLSTIVEHIFPLFTTDLSFDEYKELLYYLPLYLKYDVKVNKLPGENRIAPFKESYRYNVLLNEHAEIDTLVKEISSDKGDHKWIWWISPILVIVYVCLLAVSVMALCFVVLRKRRIVYIDPVSHEKKYKSKKYRWNKDVHVYHQDVLDDYDGGMFMNKEMTQRYSHEIKMPMHDLLVYVQTSVQNEPEDPKQSEVSQRAPAAL